MARSREKANLMFNRWTSLKEEASGPGRRADRRPYLASEVKILSDAEKWRRQVIGEITRKVADIQNAGLGEARIRDLNDEINKLLREKGHWERQIKALGGPDYALTAPKLFDGSSEGKEVPGSGGYRYFGAAKDLPGVKELFAFGEAPKKARTRGEIFKGLTPDYYGYRDEDNDPTLLAAEEEATKKIVEAKMKEQDEARQAKRRKIEEEKEAAVKTSTSSLVAGGAGASIAAGLVADEYSKKMQEDEDDDDDDLAEAEGFVGSAAFKALVPLPSQKEIEAALLEKKRQALMAKYLSAPSSK